MELASNGGTSPERGRAWRALLHTTHRAGVRPEGQAEATYSRQRDVYKEAEKRTKVAIAETGNGGHGQGLASEEGEAGLRRAGAAV